MQDSSSDTVDNARCVPIDEMTCHTPNRKTLDDEVAEVEPSYGASSSKKQAMRK